MNLISLLFRAARAGATAKAISKGPKATARRAKNIVVGRAIGRSGIWK